MAQATVEDRVALLEAHLAKLMAPAPQAAPPITIGPFNNVPAPGSPIRSDWPQQLTQYTVDLNTRVGQLQMRAGANVPTTNASGVANITYGTTFPGTPTVLVTNGNDAQRIVLSILDSTPAAFNVVARNITDAAAYAGQLIRVHWVAIYGTIATALPADLAALLEGAAA